MILDAAHVLFIAMLALALALAAALLVMRSRAGAGFLLAGFFIAVALALLTVAAPAAAMVAVVFGTGLAAALVLTSGRLLGAHAPAGGPWWSAAAVSVGVGALLVFAAAYASGFGEQGAAADAEANLVAVNRAWGLGGMRDAVAAFIANYRAIDALLVCVILWATASGVHALLGFGERAPLDRSDRKGGRV